MAYFELKASYLLPSFLKPWKKPFNVTQLKYFQTFADKRSVKKTTKVLAIEQWDGRTEYLQEFQIKQLLVVFTHFFSG